MKKFMPSKAKKNKKMDVMEVLANVPLFSGLTDDERGKLAKGLKKKQFKQNETLMKQGDSGSEFFIISDGRVEVSINDNGKKVSVATLESGDYAGEQALLQNTTRNATLTAVSERVTCLVCDQKSFKAILANNTSVNFEKREAKRPAFLTAINYDDIKQDDDEKLPEDTVNWLLGCVEGNLLFESLSGQQRKHVLAHMKLRSVKKGDFVITQGEEREKAQTFYVVESGDYDVLVDNVKVHHYARGGSFGELALIHNAPRAASVVCVSAAGNNKLWEISRKYFRYYLVQENKQASIDNLSFYNEVQIFAPLTTEKKRILNDILEQERFVNQDGAVIMQQGDVVDGTQNSKFYVIQKGKVKWSKQLDDGTQETGSLSRGQYFGEKGFQTLKELIKEANGEVVDEEKLPQRAATLTVQGHSETILLSMEYDTYTRLLDSVDHIINAHIERAYSDVSLSESSPKSTSSPKTENGAQKKKKNDAKKTAAPKRNMCKLLDLVTIGVLGKGGFGLVTLVKDPKSKQAYALKAIKKHQVIELELQKHIISEKQVMQQLNQQCEFLINLHQTYNDPLRVYFLLDVCLGGELFTILRNRRYFNEPTAMFFAASVCEGFAYMHSLDIIYRDLKPENLILDNRGYLRIADFGFAKQLKAEDNFKTYTLCGTPDYLCPEIVTGQGHGKGCDWWTVGILIYEMLASFPPFVADEPIETYRKIIRGRIRFPRYFSQDVRELIRGLLHNKPGRRLGVLMPKDPRFREPADVIRKHPWFKQFNWDALNAGTLDAPIANKVANDTDLRNFAKVEVDDEEALPIDKSQDFGHYFEEF